MTEIIGGHYRIVKHLGGGGFGQTYIAEDIHLPDKPLCVVKLLMPLTRKGTEVVPLPKNSPDFKIAERLFNTEAQVLYKLGEHDQIPKLLAHFEDNQEFYLVQQLIEGQNLSQEIIGQQWNETQVIDLLLNILTPLAFVHQHQVIHRDLKPDNLIRRKQDSKIVLIDFGAVKEVISQTTTTDGKSRTIGIGTPGYMPSEQYIGKPTLSSDIYAVGMIAIQALTGLYPTQLPSDPITGQINWHDLVQISPKLTEILDKMTRENCHQRYNSAKEALQAISSFKKQPSTTIKINNRNKKLINSKSIITAFTAFLTICIGLLIFTHSFNLKSTQNETQPESETPAF
jgi:serine/threonine protein kinase